MKLKNFNVEPIDKNTALQLTGLAENDWRMKEPDTHFISVRRKSDNQLFGVVKIVPGGYGGFSISNVWDMDFQTRQIDFAFSVDGAGNRRVPYKNYAYNWEYASVPASYKSFLRELERWLIDYALKNMHKEYLDAVVAEYKRKIAQRVTDAAYLRELADMIERGDFSYSFESAERDVIGVLRHYRKD